MFLGVVLSPELDEVQEEKKQMQEVEQERLKGTVSSELYVVRKNEEEQQLQEVELEKLKGTPGEDEIICDDTFQMETVVEIIHQKH